MAAFVTARLASFALALVVVSLIVFFATDVLPGDAAQTLLGPDASPEIVAALAHKLALDRPAPERYLAFIGGVLTGDFGVSAAYDAPAAGLIAERLAVSLPLAFMAMALALTAALGLGLFAARRHNRAGDFAVMGLAQMGMAIPGFWLAILLILLFAAHLRWLPAGGFPGWQAGVGPAVRALILPAVALAFAQAAILTRVTRASVLEALGQDYVRTARAKGLSEAQILRRHVLRNALSPIVTLAGLQFANLIASAVVIETVFALPGLARLIFQSIGARDHVVVRDCVLLLAAGVVSFNFITDLAQAALDPRLSERTE